MMSSSRRSHRTMVKLSDLSCGKAMCARGRLVVMYSLLRTTRVAWARAPSCGLCRALAFVAWGSRDSSFCALPVACVLRPSPDRP
jgi:hypothetical protein